MPGLQELLILAGVAGAAFFYPRFKQMLVQGKPVDEPRPAKRRKRRGLPGPMRLFIIVSIFVPIAAAIYFEPWNGNLRRFLYIGVAPIVVAWCTWWIRRGFKNS